MQKSYKNHHEGLSYSYVYFIFIVKKNPKKHKTYFYNLPITNSINKLQYEKKISVTINSGHI